MVSSPSPPDPSRNAARALAGGQIEAALRKPGRRERRSQEFRDRIYQAAQSIFLEYGFGTTTVNIVGRRPDPEAEHSSARRSNGVALERPDHPIPTPESELLRK